jgi:hypothetical protein
VNVFKNGTLLSKLFNRRAEEETGKVGTAYFNTNQLQFEGTTQPYISYNTGQGPPTGITTINSSNERVDIFSKTVEKGLVFLSFIE